MVGAGLSFDPATRERVQRAVYALFDRTRDALRDAELARERVARAVPDGSPCERLMRVREREWIERADEARRIYDEENRNQLNQGSWDEALMNELLRHELDARDMAELVATDPARALEHLRSTATLRLGDFEDRQRELVELQRQCSPP